MRKTSEGTVQILSALSKAVSIATTNRRLDGRVHYRLGLLLVLHESGHPRSLLFVGPPVAVLGQFGTDLFASLQASRKAWTARTSGAWNTPVTIGVVERLNLPWHPSTGTG
jgi:hypothetical protein